MFDLKTPPLWAASSGHGRATGMPAAAQFFESAVTVVYERFIGTFSGKLYRIPDGFRG
jgi:hypothetical protein